MLYLDDNDVDTLLPMKDCLEVIETLFRQESEGLVENRPRQTVQVRYGFHRAMMGAAFGFNAFGLKTYTPSRLPDGRGGMRYLVLLYDFPTGALSAIVEARRLGELRTGAAAGVATKYLARPDAETVGMIGTGREARAQLDAMCGVRPVKRVRAYSRTPERREAFAQEMSARFGIEVTAVASGEEAVRGADIVVTITSTNTPVLEGAWLQPGTHLNAVGATSIARREIDEEAVRRADRVVVESREQAQQECGELIYAAERGMLRWNRVLELGQVVGGEAGRRTGADEITLFDSLGVGSEDVAAAACVLQRARERGMGREVPIPEIAGA
jgi:ornithine cyclodeaminase/alanine dehydrogenase-like protein (mu-crystallin family)